MTPPTPPVPPAPPASPLPLTPAPTGPACPLPDVTLPNTPATGDAIAPDLTTLMERMERTRKHLRVEREYIKLVLIGGWFILMGAILTPGFPWRLLLILALAATPFLVGWYNLPLLRLGNTFKNETVPFLLRDYGRWNYALNGTHFSRDLLKRTGLLQATDTLSVTNIMTGERFGIPLQMAVLSAWPQPRFGIYRGMKATFEGWALNIRLPDLPLTPALILPTGTKPGHTPQKSWAAQALTAHHQLFLPPDQPEALPPVVLARLLPLLTDHHSARCALLDGILWVLVPTDPLPFSEARNFADPLYEPAPYERARTSLARIFKWVDDVVWPRGS